MDYEKPKRKGLPRQNMWTFLSAGFIFVFGVGLAGFFLFAESKPESVMVAPDGVVVQSVQSSSVTSNVESIALSRANNQLGILLNMDGTSLFNLLPMSTLTSLNDDVITMPTGQNFDQVVMSADGKYVLLSSFADSTVALMRLEDGAIVQQHRAQMGAISPDSTQMVLVQDATLSLQSIDSTVSTQPASLTLDRIASAIVYSPDGTQVAVVVQNMVEASWRLEVFQTQALTNPSQGFDLDGIVIDLDYHPSGRFIAVTQEDGVHVFDLVESGTRAFNFNPMGIARTVTFTPNGEWLIVAGGDSANGITGIIYASRWYDTNTPIPPDENFLVPIVVGRHDGDVTSVVATADGGIISGSGDGSIRLWHIEDMREVSRLQF